MAAPRSIELYQCRLSLDFIKVPRAENDDGRRGGLNSAISADLVVDPLDDVVSSSAALVVLWIYGTLGEKLDGGKALDLYKSVTK